MLDDFTITEGLLMLNGLTSAVGYLLPYSFTFTKGYSLLDEHSGPRALLACIRKTASARLQGFTTSATAVASPPGDHQLYG